MTENVAMLAIVGAVAVTLGALHCWNQERIRLHADPFDDEDEDAEDEDDDPLEKYQRGRLN